MCDYPISQINRLGELGWNTASALMVVLSSGTAGVSVGFSGSGPRSEGGPESEKRGRVSPLSSDCPQARE